MPRTPEDEWYIARTVARARRLIREQPDIFLALGDLRPQDGRRRHVKVLDHGEWVQVDAELHMESAFEERWAAHDPCVMSDDDFQKLLTSVWGHGHPFPIARASR